MKFIICIIITGIIVGGIVLIILNDPQNIQRPSCENIKGTALNYNCCVDCHKFSYNYLNYHFSRSGIGRNSEESCHCKNGNKSIQIY